MTRKLLILGFFALAGLGTAACNGDDDTDDTDDTEETDDGGGDTDTDA